MASPFVELEVGARTVKVTNPDKVLFPSGRHADELCVTELAQVMWGANLAVIDFHPWPSRRSDVDRPDELRIDVDPQPGTTFEDGKRVAGIELPEDARRAGARAALARQETGVARCKACLTSN